MNPGLFLNFLSHQAKLDRREFLDVVGKTGIAGAIATFGLLHRPAHANTGRKHGGGDKYTDDIFDYADPANLSDWAPSRYGAGDQRGSFNEVTRERTADTLRAVLDPRKPVKTYNLGELMWNGFPAFVTTPARGYQQRMTLTGYPPPPGFLAGGGYLTQIPGLGSNQLSVHEERFPSTTGAPAGLTYQIGTQLDNLNHIGAGVFLYNGFRGPDVLTAQGTSKLGNEHMGPIVTRGVVLDVLGLKLARGDAGALGPNAPNGKPVLRSNYRITLEDIHDAMEMAGIRRIQPGDAVLFRTGWNQLLQGRTPEGIARWSGAEGLPGIYVAEGNFLGHRRPALVASDTWALEVLGSPDNVPGTAFPVHQDLIMRYGVRIGESVVLDELVKDRVYECVYMVTPQFAEGATCGSTPPAALAQPRRH
jgi:hypothetical protein